MIYISITRSELEAVGACPDGLSDFDALAKAQGQIANTWSFVWSQLFAIEFARGPYKHHLPWLIGKGIFPILDLSSARLSGADLRYANLSSARLSGADLSSARLSGADLRYANLSSARLSNADLSGARLSCADLIGADLSGANLSSARLSGADLSCADLSCADLIGADLSGARLSNADLSCADLRDAYASPVPAGWKLANGVLRKVT